MRRSYPTEKALRLTSPHLLPYPSPASLKHTDTGGRAHQSWRASTYPWIV